MIEHFQDPLPDETLYSVWARLSELSNFHTLSDVFEELFNNRKIKPIVDLPCHLGHFFDRLPFGHCYTIDVLINDHTLLPFYAPFLPHERYRSLREQMMSGNGKAVQRRAGILNIRIPQPLYLRYCPMCVERDREKFGACYWHRLHQVPGVVVCPTHAVFLENSTVHAQSTFSRQEFIPAERVISTPVSRWAESSPLYTFFRDIALDAAYLLKNPTSSLGVEFLKKQYSALLAQNRFLTLGEMVRKADLITAFVDYYPAELLHLLNCEVYYARNRQTWLTSLPYRSKHTLHPLHHLLAIRFFGSTIQEFCHREFQSPQFFEPGPWPCLNPVCDHYQQCSINTYQIREMTKGKYQGIFTCKCGFSYSRYTQIGSAFSSDSGSEKRAILSYGPVWESKLCELWLDPTVSQKEIVRRLHISQVCLKWHATEMHLLPTRAYSATTASPLLTDSTEQSRSWYRSQWLNLLQGHPEETGVD
jgi:Tn7-like transposition protein D/TniQ